MLSHSTPTILAEDFFRLNAELFAPYLHEVGLDEQVLHSPDSEIPLARYIALWEVLGREVDPAIGLRIGSSTHSSALGAFGHALRSAPSIPLMLRCLSHFIVVFSHATRVGVEEDQQGVKLSYQITEASIVQRRQDAEFSLALALTLIREITGDARLVPLRIDFEHAAPADLSVHRELFQCPLYFDQPDNRGYFSHELLALPVRTGDSRLFSALQPFLEEQRQRRVAPSDLLSRLGHHIASSLSSGGTSLELMARSLGMGPRTLQRRLAEQQVEFSQLVEDVRRALARQYVAGGEYSITEVALLLGYAEASSFSRAFRRWTGQSPQAYRQQVTDAGCQTI